MPAKAKSVDTKAKRHRKRKPRTEVSSLSESSGGSGDESGNGQVTSSMEQAPLYKNEPNQAPSEKKQSKKPRSASPEPVEALTPEDSKDVQEAQRTKPADFSAFYLRHITSELAEDLDKIRTACDFTDSALPLLVHALQQGESLFSAEEKRRVMGGF